jgi:hypothetical protein
MLTETGMDAFTERDMAGSVTIDRKRSGSSNMVSSLLAVIGRVHINEGANEIRLARLSPHRRLALCSPEWAGGGHL